MKHTKALKVVQGDEPSGNTLRIHPNDGFDLGLMTYTYQMKIFNNCSAEDFNHGSAGYIEGTVEQANECPLGTVQVNYRMNNKLSLPQSVKLVAMKDKLLLLHLG